MLQRCRAVRHIFGFPPSHFPPKLLCKHTTGCRVFSTFPRTAVSHVITIGSPLGTRMLHPAANLANLLADYAGRLQQLNGLLPGQQGGSNSVQAHNVQVPDEVANQYSSPVTRLLHPGGAADCYVASLSPQQVITLAAAVLATSKSSSSRSSSHSDYSLATLQRNGRLLLLDTPLDCTPAVQGASKGTSSQLVAQLSQLLGAIPKLAAPSRCSSAGGTTTPGSSAVSSPGASSTADRLVCFAVGHCSTGGLRGEHGDEVFLLMGEAGVGASPSGSSSTGTTSSSSGNVSGSTGGSHGAAGPHEVGPAAEAAAQDAAAAGQPSTAPVLHGWSWAVLDPSGVHQDTAQALQAAGLACEYVGADCFLQQLPGTSGSHVLALLLGHAAGMLQLTTQPRAHPCSSGEVLSVQDAAWQAVQVLLGSQADADLAASAVTRLVADGQLQLGLLGVRVQAAGDTAAIDFCEENRRRDSTGGSSAGSDGGLEAAAAILQAWQRAVDDGFACVEADEAYWAAAIAAADAQRLAIRSSKPPPPQHKGPSTTPVEQLSIQPLQQQPQQQQQQEDELYRFFHTAAQPQQPQHQQPQHQQPQQQLQQMQLLLHLQVQVQLETGPSSSGSNSSPCTARVVGAAVEIVQGPKALPSQQNSAGLQQAHCADEPQKPHQQQQQDMLDKIKLEVQLALKSGPLSSNPCTATVVGAAAEAVSPPEAQPSQQHPAGLQQAGGADGPHEQGVSGPEQEPLQQQLAGASAPVSSEGFSTTSSAPSVISSTTMTTSQGGALKGSPPGSTDHGVAGSTVDAAGTGSLALGDDAWGQVGASRAVCSSRSSSGGVLQQPTARVVTSDRIKRWTSNRMTVSPQPYLLHRAQEQQPAAPGLKGSLVSEGSGQLGTGVATSSSGTDGGGDSNTDSDSGSMATSPTTTPQDQQPPQKLQQLSQSQQPQQLALQQPQPQSQPPAVKRRRRLPPAASEAGLQGMLDLTELCDVLAHLDGWVHPSSGHLTYVSCRDKNSSTWLGASAALGLPFFTTHSHSPHWLQLGPVSGRQQEMQQVPDLQGMQSYGCSKAWPNADDDNSSGNVLLSSSSSSSPGITGCSELVMYRAGYHFRLFIANHGSKQVLYFDSLGCGYAEETARQLLIDAASQMVDSAGCIHMQDPSRPNAVKLGPFHEYYLIPLLATGAVQTAAMNTCGAHVAFVAMAYITDMCGLRSVVEEGGRGEGVQAIQAALQRCYASAGSGDLLLDVVASRSWWVLRQAAAGNTAAVEAV